MKGLIISVALMLLYTSNDGEVRALASIIQSEAVPSNYKDYLCVGNVVIIEHEQTGKPISEIVANKLRYNGYGNANYKNPSKMAYKAARAIINGKRVLPADTRYYLNPLTATNRAQLDYVDTLEEVACNELMGTKFCHKYYKIP